MEWTEGSARELIELYKKKINNMGPKAPNAFYQNQKARCMGRNWEKKRTDPSMSAKRKWRIYCHLSDGRKLR